VEGPEIEAQPQQQEGRRKPVQSAEGFQEGVDPKKGDIVEGGPECQRHLGTPPGILSGPHAEGRRIPARAATGASRGRRREGQGREGPQGRPSNRARQGIGAW